MSRYVDIYRATRKKPDLVWNTYVCRPAATVFVDAFAETPVTPNQVTLLALFVALLSAGMLVTWLGYVGLVVAILVYEFSYVLDCVDGMLARWRGTQSTKGHLLDFLMDEIKAFVMLGAVAVRLFRETADVDFLLFGLFGLIALASGIALTTFLRRPEIASPAASSANTAPRSVVQRAVTAVESVSKLLIHYPSYIWLAALLGHIELYLYPYVLVNAAYAARTFAQVAVRFGRPSGA